MKIADAIRRSGLLMLAWLVAGAAIASAQPAVAINSTKFEFSHQLGSASPIQAQTLQVYSAPADLAFTVAAQVVSPPTATTWLTVNGASNSSGTTGNDLTSRISISVAPTGLAAGQYNSQIVLNVTGASQIVIPVTMKISAAPQIALTVPFINLQGQTGTQVSTTTLVKSTGVPIPFTAAVTQSYGEIQNWLSITPNVGTTDQSVIVVANLLNAPAGLYFGVVTFTSGGADPGNVTLPVIVNVAQESNIAANPIALNFAFQASNLGGTPNNKVINITSAPLAAMAYTATASGDSRISISKSPAGPGGTVLQGTTPEDIYVLVNPAGIAAGSSITGTVNIMAGTKSVNVPVSVTVTNAPLLVSSPESVSFAYTLGAQAPASVSLSLTASSGNLGFQLAEAEVTGGDWLTVGTTGVFTPANVAVSVNPTRLAQLAAGTYTATITIASPSAQNSPVTIPVTLTVSGSALFTVTPSNLAFSAALQGSAPTAQTVTAASTDGSNQSFNVTVEPPSAAAWLVLSDYSGQTGATGKIVTVNVRPNALNAAGLYEASIVFTPQTTGGGAAVAQRVQVAFTVTSTTALTATPVSVNVTQSGATAPAAVPIQIASAVQGIQFIARSSVPWITVTPTSGSTPSALSLSFTTTDMAPGKYEGIVTVVPSGASELNIPVTLTIGVQAALTISQNAFTVNYVQGTPTPTPLIAGLTSSGAAINFTAVAASPNNWLSVSPASGATAASGGAATNLTLTVNPAGLAPNTYAGTVTVTGANAAGPAQTINVTLVVSTQAQPAIRQLENSARNEVTRPAPGLIVAIKGTNLGPATGVSGKVTNGSFDKVLSEVRVLFDGQEAPILYARHDQINVVAPYFLYGRTTTRLQVEYRGVKSEAGEYQIVDVAPGIFTQDSTGRGLGAILNQDGSVNAQANPARPGDIIAIYATGEGAVRPTGTDGKLTAGTIDSLPRPLLPVTVRLNGQVLPVENVVYAGSAPGLVAGAMQVNVRIPANLSIPAATMVPIEVNVGTNASQPGVTVAIAPRT